MAARSMWCPRGVGRSCMGSEGSTVSLLIKIIVHKKSPESFLCTNFIPWALAIDWTDGGCEQLRYPLPTRR